MARSEASDTVDTFILIVLRRFLLKEQHSLRRRRKSVLVKLERVGGMLRPRRWVACFRDKLFFRADEFSLGILYVEVESSRVTHAVGIPKQR